MNMKITAYGRCGLENHGLWTCLFSSKELKPMNSEYFHFRLLLIAVFFTTHHSTLLVTQTIQRVFERVLYAAMISLVLLLCVAMNLHARRPKLFRMALQITQFTDVFNAWILDIIGKTKNLFFFSE